jgi:hypothetical protein
MVGNPLKPVAGLENLLNLDGEMFPMDNGYWTKFEARRVPVSGHRRNRGSCLKCGRARSRNLAGANPAPEGRPATG